MVVFLLLQVWRLWYVVVFGTFYILCGCRIKCTLNGVAIHKFLSNSAHRRKDTSMSHRDVSVPVHNYYHLVTANLHNQEVGKVKL